MITGTKNILGVPAAQRQSRDRQQRRRQQRRKADQGSDEEKPKSRGPAIIRIKERSKLSADPAADSQKQSPRQLSSDKRKRRRVDIRI